jgi:hypothetical protein
VPRAAAIVLVLASLVPASAGAVPTVTRLPLPGGATVDPFGGRRLMTAAADGSIAATVTAGGFRTEVVRWDRRGKRVPLANVAGSVVEFGRGGSLLVNAGRPRRLTGLRNVPVDTAYCEDFPHSSIGPQLAGTLDNGALVATMLSPALVNLDDTSGQEAPVVLYLRSRQCLNVGNGIALATAGLYAAGYAAFIENVPAPSNVVSSKERFTAMRWRERTPDPLGPGVALAVNASGAAAGADVPPGRGAVYDTAPHARYWPASGPAVDVAENVPLSVAYAIDARDRVTGMLEDAAGRHYAFVWARGTLRRLDDAVAAPDWRFECGYTFTPEGGIAGIGSYRGRPAAFVVDGL